MNENKIRESKRAIPEMDPTLKEKIASEYEKRQLAKKTRKFKPWHAISIASCCLVAAITIGIIEVNSFKKPTNKSNKITEEYVPYSKADDEGGYDDFMDDGKWVPGTSTLEEYSAYEAAEFWMDEPEERAYSESKTEKHSEEKGVFKPGQLTASAINDNDDFEFFKSLVSKGQEAKDTGIFYNIYGKYDFKTLNRVKVTLPKNAKAEIKLLDDNKNVVFIAKNDVNGNAYLFSKDYYENYDVVINYVDNNGTSKTYSTKAAAEIDLSDTLKMKQYSNSKVIDLMLVLDTTGSMGDEINYLKSELSDVINKVQKANSNVDVNLSILAYKDYCDEQVEYLTRFSNFSNKINKQQSFLDNLYASGGGDFPEAVYTAMDMASKANWSEDSTKIMLFVADAPAHENEINKWNESVTKLAEEGVRIITLASSGIDKDTEYFFRCQSMMTNGHYTYLTNHSGIGGEHIEATTSNPVEVEYVNSMLVRLINGYYSGEFSEPINYLQDSQSYNQ